MPRSAQGLNSWEADLPKLAWGVTLQDAAMPQLAGESAP